MDGNILALIGVTLIPTATVIVVGIRQAGKIGKVEGKCSGMNSRLDSVDSRLSGIDTCINTMSQRVNHIYSDKKAKGECKNE